jgi:outer membrane protein OmpA-like peptidoglycan-associated protein
MPRGHYTWEVPDKRASSATGAHKVSMSQYEALLQLYEAQNAVGIARAAGAATYAANTFDKAQGLLNEAQSLQDRKAPTGRVVQEAREAAQTAEDARMIAERRRQDERIAQAEQQASAARQAEAQAQNNAQRSNGEAEAARSQAQAERVARERAEADAAEARRRAAEAEASRAVESPAPPPPPPQQQPDAPRSELRMQLFDQLNGVAFTRDTPRGLVVTVGDAAFRGSQLRESTSEQMARVAAILAREPGLRVDVEGNSDTAADAPASWLRAEAVRNALVRQGLPADRVAARGLGDSRLLVANSSPGARERNRRVELVISGNPIGNLAFWDRKYSVAPNLARSR